VGRSKELNELVQGLVSDGVGPIAVLGPLGVGKSTVISKALHHADVVRRFGNQRHFVNCDGCTSTEAVLAAIYSAVGVDVTSAPLALEQVLAAGPLVLVLDNFETAWEADQTAAELLLGRLASVGGVALVVAVRGRERPAELPWKTVLQIEPFSPEAARECFLKVAGREFAVDPRLDELLSKLEFLPHAIALLAHQAQGEPDLSEIKSRWEAEASLMLVRRPGNDRATSFEISCWLSIGSPRMTQDAMLALAVLSLMPVGIARSDLDGLGEIVSFDGATVLRKLGLAADDISRIRVLAPVREFASRSLRITNAARAALAAYMLKLIVENSGPFGSLDARGKYRRLAAEVPNVNEIFKISAELFDYTFVCEAARAWAEFLRVVGVGPLAPLELAIGLAAKHGDARLEGQCFRGLGDVLLARQQITQALAAYKLSLPLLEKVDDWYSVADAYKRMGHLYRGARRYSVARKLYQKARGLYRSQKDKNCEADCIIGLAEVEMAVDNISASLKLATKALMIYRTTDSHYGIAGSLLLYGAMAAREGDLDRATALYTEAKAHFEKIGVDAGAGASLLRLAGIAEEKHEAQQAIELYRQAAAAFRSIGIEFNAAAICERLAKDDARRRADNAN
jgi:tetratricopeptide (TPR) repeat protein